jgi:hypothetical protein
MNFSSKSVSSTTLVLQKKTIRSIGKSDETNPFLSNASQYRTNNSGDIVALLFINFPQIYNNFNDRRKLQ